MSDREYAQSISIRLSSTFLSTPDGKDALWLLVGFNHPGHAQTCAMFDNHLKSRMEHLFDDCLQSSVYDYVVAFIQVDCVKSHLFNTSSIPLFDFLGDIESSSGTLYDC